MADDKAHAVLEKFGLKYIIGKFDSEIQVKI